MLLLSHLFLVCHHQGAFLRICRSNQFSPDCLTVSVVFRTIPVLLKNDTFEYLPCLPVFVNADYVVVFLALDSQAKDLGFPGGFRNTFLLLLLLSQFVSPLTQNHCTTTSILPFTLGNLPGLSKNRSLPFPG